MMNSKRLWISASIIAIVILVGFVLSVPHTRDLPQETTLKGEAPKIPEVAIADTYKKGMHTIIGSLEVKNSCTSISTAVSLGGTASTTQGIFVAITVPEDTGVCLQIPARASFKTTLTAPANLPIAVTVNGLPATTSAP